MVDPLLWWTVRRLRSRDWPTRARAVERLGRFSNPRAKRPLFTALADEFPLVRQAAAQALGRFSGPDVIEALRIALRDDCFVVVQAAACALNQSGFEPADPDDTAGILVGQGKWDDVASFGASAIPRLLPALRDKNAPDICGGAARALRGMCGERAVTQ